MTNEMRISGTVGLLIIVYSSDHFRERSLHTVGGMCLGIVGCIVMATSVNTQLRYGFAHVCMAGVFVGGPLIAVLLAGNTPWKGTRSVIMGVNGWSNIAGVIAGQLFKSRYRPRCKSSSFNVRESYANNCVRRATSNCHNDHHGMRYLRIGVSQTHVHSREQAEGEDDRHVG